MTTYAPQLAAAGAEISADVPPTQPGAGETRWFAARIGVTVGLITGILGLVATIGADAGWLTALGHVVSVRGAVPRGVPFASASTVHWVNTLVLAELIFNALQQLFGSAGLIVAQLVAVGVGLVVLAGDARAGGARSPAIAGALLLVALGAFPSLAVARVQLFSLVLFPVMIALLRAEARNPSKRIWLALPLLALWSNLHGAALSGLAVLYLYLAFSRLREAPRTAVAVAVAALAAVCLTPGGVRTVDYYHGLVTNLAAERGVGQWAPFGHSPFDWVLLAVAAVLLLRLRARRPALWEIGVLVVLTALTLKAGRNGVWLLFVLVAPAAQAMRPGRAWNGLLPLGAVLAVVLLAIDAGHWPTIGHAGRNAARQAITRAHGTPILADGLLAEDVAAEGGQIWAGNPIDAFSRHVQAEYLAWLAGAPDGRAALAVRSIRVVLAVTGSPDARLTARDRAFVHVATDGPVEIYERHGV